MMKGKDYQETAHWSILMIVDMVLLILILALALWLRLLRGRGRQKLWSVLFWWFLGSAITVMMDFLTVLAEQAMTLQPNVFYPRKCPTWPVNSIFDFGPRLKCDFGLWFDVLNSTLYVVSLAVLTAVIFGVTLRASTWRMRAERSAAWSRFRIALPLFVGTLAAYVGSTLWDNVLDRHAQRDGYIHMMIVDCHGAINQQYFAQISQIIPLLLVGVGLEAKVFERLLKEPTQHAMTILTVVILCIGELLALSTLPLSNADCGQLLKPWHEYSAFIITLYASSVALAMLVWALLVASPPDKPSQKFARSYRKRAGAKR
jgi:hypothetical protein